jgi:hypothetical protein
VLAAAALLAPASAHAQGAGDDQYQDPFGSSGTGTTRRTSTPQRTQRTQQKNQPSLSQAPPAGTQTAPSQTAPAPSAAAPAPAPAPAGALARTGAEVPGMALLGLGLLAAGVGLRLRTVDESLF